MKTFPREEVVEAFRRHGFFGRAAEASLHVLVHGKSRKAAAHDAGVDPAAVTRFLNRFTVEVSCPCCGQQVKEIDLTL